MTILEKITDFLLKKNWVLFLLSFLFGIIIITFMIPIDLYDKLPFNNHDIRVIIVLCGTVTFSYLSLSLITYIINKILVFKKNRNTSKSLKEQQQKELDKAVEANKSYLDSLSDFDYNIVRQLVYCENKKTLQFKGTVISTVLQVNSNWFYISISQETIIPPWEKNLRRPPIPMHQNITKIKLRDATYTLFKYIIDSTGSLTHISKNEFDVGELVDN